MMYRLKISFIFSLFLASCGGTIGSIDSYTLEKCDHAKLKESIFSGLVNSDEYNSFRKVDTCRNGLYNCLSIYIAKPETVIVTCRVNVMEKTNQCFLVFTHVKIDSERPKINDELSILERFKYRKLIKDSIVDVLNKKYDMNLSNE